jgi:hypothetical protein
MLGDHARTENASEIDVAVGARWMNQLTPFHPPVAPDTNKIIALDIDSLGRQRGFGDYDIRGRLRPKF